MSKYTYTHLDLFLIRNVDDDVKQLGIIMAFSRANFHQGTVEEQEVISTQSNTFCCCWTPSNKKEIS